MKGRAVALLGIVLALGLSGCGKHTPAKAPGYEVVHRSTYVYQRLNDGEFVIAAIDSQALKQAMAEIGCGATYVCELERTGELYDVELHRK